MSYKTNNPTINKLVDDKVGVTIQGHSTNLDELATENLTNYSEKLVGVNPTGNGFIPVDIPDTIVGKRVPISIAFSATNGWDADETLFSYIATENITFVADLVTSKAKVVDLGPNAALVTITVNDEVKGTILLASTGVAFDSEEFTLQADDVLELKSSPAGEFSRFTLNLVGLKLANYVS